MEGGKNMNLIPKDFFLDDVFSDFLTSKESNNLKCDIYEQDGKYYIEMDAHGFKKDDLNIEFDKGYLNISIAKNEEKKDEGRNYIRKERYSKEYKRSFYIGDIDAENLKAEFNDGLLKISIPKKEEVENKKIINIE